MLYEIRRQNRFSRIMVMAFIVGAAEFTLLAPSANAESLIFKDTVQNTPEKAWVVRRPDVAFRYFGRLESKDAADYFSITLKKDQTIELGLETPTADGEFQPHLVFFGPGLSKPKEDPVIQIGEPNGAIVIKTETRESFFDRLTLTNYYQGPTLTFVAPKDATYGLAVRSAKAETGRYIIRFKGNDGFDWSRFLDFILNVFRAILRMY